MSLTTKISHDPKAAKMPTEVKKITRLMELWRIRREDTATDPRAFVRSLVKRFQLLHKSPHGDFMKDHGLAFVSCVFAFSGVESGNGLSLANVVEIFQAFQLNLKVSPVDGETSIYEVSLAYKEITIFEHLISASPQWGEAILGADSPGRHPALHEIQSAILRILYCLSEENERTNRQYTSLFEELALVRAMENRRDPEMLARLKRHCFILHFAANRDLYTRDFMDLATLSGLAPSRALDDSRRLIHSRLVKNPIMDKSFANRFTACGICKNSILRNLDLLHWFSEITTLDAAAEISRDLSLEAFCGEYDRSDSGFNPAEPEGVMTYPSMLIFEYFTGRNRANAALGRTQLFGSRKRPHCKQNFSVRKAGLKAQLEVLLPDRKVASSSTQRILVAEHLPPRKILVDEMSVSDRANLPQIDFTCKALRLPSAEFEAILNIWFFLYSIPRKVRLTRTSHDLFIQAMMSDADTRIVQEAVRGLLFVLGHKFSTSVNQGGYFRVSVRTNVIAEAVNFLKKLTSTGDKESVVVQKARKFFDAMKGFGWNLYWSRLPMAHRIELFELLCTYARKSGDICEYFEELHKSTENSGELSTFSKLGESMMKSETTDEAFICIRPLGLDRYRRIYWKFPMDSRIFVQVTEDSMEWNVNDQFVVPTPGLRPSVILDDEEDDESQSDASPIVKTIGWGTIAAESVHFLESSLVPNGVFESSLLENLQSVLKLLREAKESADGDGDGLEYPLTRSRMLSPLQRYENFLY